MSRSQLDLDYTNTGDGDYESDLTSVHPYLGWTAGRLDLWATAGDNALSALELSDGATLAPAFGTGTITCTASIAGVSRV